MRPFVVYASAVLIFVLSLIKPYYLLPTFGDTDYHLVRARELMEDPLKGLYWDYLRCYPQGKAVFYPPMFHISTALLWVIGGVRFAHSFLAVFQVVFIAFAASFFAKRYGQIAGMSAGFLIFLSPRVDFFSVPIPSAYLFPLILLSICCLADGRTSAAFFFSLLALVTHPGAILVVPVLFLFYGYRKPQNLSMILGLSPVWLLSVGYWMYFKGQLSHWMDLNIAGHITKAVPLWLSNPQPYYALFVFLGVLGILIERRRVETRAVLFAAGILALFAFLYGDYSRFLHYGSVPLAIYSGVALQAGYNAIKYKDVALVFVINAVLLLLLLIPNMYTSLLSSEAGWHLLDKEFESPYGELKSYIEEETSPEEVVYADNELADKIAWMTGRKISNCGMFGVPRTGYSPTRQRVNVLFAPHNESKFEILPGTL